MGNILKEIEQKYHVDVLEYNNEQIWSILRWIYFDQIRIKKNNIKRNKKRKLDYFKEFFYNWTKWFPSYDFLFFSASEKSIRREINGKYFDRFMDPIIDLLGKKNCLLIEMPAPEHHPNKVYTNNITSYTSLNVLFRFLSFFHKKIKLKDTSILDSIKKNYEIQINDEEIVKNHLIKIRFYKTLYKHLKTKAIFIVEPGRDLARISAANELGIPTIEVQHGLIGQEHPAYNIYYNMNDNYRCKYLFAFSESERELSSPPFIYKPENIYPIGSYYIEYIKKEYVIDQKLKKHFEQYKKTVAVTLQKNIEKELLAFILSAAKKDDRILYLLVPRQKMDFTSPLSNVELIYQPNFYELMKYVSFHVTVFSSTALEAPTLGIANILVNINGLAKQYFADVLTDPRITRFVETPSELVKMINEFKPATYEEIIESSHNHVITNYSENLKKTLITLQFNP